MDILSVLMGLGLAAGAGSRASMVVLGLGLFHHTAYFELTGPYEWVGSIPVLFVLGVLALLEVAADLSPDVSELSDLAGYAPSFIAGFLALAAATGHLDRNLVLLGTSGLLGAGVAVGTRWVRNRVATVFRELSDVSGDEVHKARSGGESIATAGVVASAFVWPLLAASAIVAVMTVVLVWLARRRGGNQGEGSR